MEIIVIALSHVIERNFSHQNKIIKLMVELFALNELSYKPYRRSNCLQKPPALL